MKLEQFLTPLVLAGLGVGCGAQDSDGPCQPGPTGPPAVEDYALPRSYPNCDQACWELAGLAPPGGGMPSGAKLVSCSMHPSGHSVRCVVQYYNLCLTNAPY